MVCFSFSFLSTCQSDRIVSIVGDIAPSGSSKFFFFFFFQMGFILFGSYFRAVLRSILLNFYIFLFIFFEREWTPEVRFICF